MSRVRLKGMDQMPVRAFAVSPRTGDIILGAPEAANPDKIFTA